MRRNPAITAPASSRCAVSPSQGEPAIWCVARLRPAVLVAALAVGVLTAGAPTSIAGDATFGSEGVSNECSDAADINMAAYSQCLDAKRDQQRKILDTAVDHALSTARGSAITESFAPAIEHAEGDWTKWMTSECTLGGLIDGGSAAPTPWLERCELRMMRQRVATIQSLQRTLLSLMSPPHRDQSSSK